MIVTENYESYVKMPNYHLRDSRLSYKARGLFSVILNLPYDWHLTQKGLILISDKDGDRSVRSAIKELLDLGYLTRNFSTTFIRIQTDRRIKMKQLTLQRKKVNVKTTVERMLKRWKIMNPL